MTFWCPEQKLPIYPSKRIIITRALRVHRGLFEAMQKYRKMAGNEVWMCRFIKDNARRETTKLNTLVRMVRMKLKAEKRKAGAITDDDGFEDYDEFEIDALRSLVASMHETCWLRGIIALKIKQLERYKVRTSEERQRLRAQIEFQIRRPPRRREFENRRERRPVEQGLDHELDGDFDHGFDDEFDMEMDNDDEAQ